MAKGLPKWAIREAKARGAKNIFAYAWTLVKRKGKKGSRKSNPKKTKRRGGLKMAKKKRRYSRSLTIPLAPVIGLGVGLTTAPPGYSDGPIGWFLKGNWQNGMRAGLGPVVLGMLIHKFVGGSPLNLNRILARHKIPLLRI